MRLKKLHLKNFRCFEELIVNFTTDYTVLIGINGSGKSSILDAIRIFFSSWTEAQEVNQIQNQWGLFYKSQIIPSDVRRHSHLMGSVFESIPQYPVSVEGTIEINAHTNISWQHTLTTPGYVNKEENFNGSQLMDYMPKLHSQLLNEEKSTLPIIASYGTNRRLLTTEKDADDKQKEEPLEYFLPRLEAYRNCLDTNIFKLDSMKKWFARMLLIERKKNIPEFQAVKNAITTCYMNIDRRKNLENVLVDYDAEVDDIEIQLFFDNGNYEALPFNYLSDGSKRIFMLVAGIAYRMAVLNPHLLGNVIQKTDGVVLIDEIDMHLHPSWQRRIVGSLHETFPNVQFIFTTHSPTVLTSIPKENILVLDNGTIHTPEIHTKGRDVNSILRELMHSDVRPPETQKKLTDFSNAIDEENFDEAEKILNELREELGDKDSEVVGAQVTLDLERL